MRLDAAPQKKPPQMKDKPPRRRHPKAQVGTAAPVAATEASAGPVDEQDRKVAEKADAPPATGSCCRARRKDRTGGQTALGQSHTTNMLFVDQHGAKVALMPATAVAHKMRDGTVRPMQQETSSFVARSLRRIRRAP